MASPYPYRTRRTIKPAAMDSLRTVDHDLLLEILTDAHWAPTHGLTQPWGFHVYSGDGRLRLAEGLQTLYDRVTVAGEIRPEKRAKLRDGPLLAPVVVAATAFVESGGKISRQDELCAAACAVQNLLLSAHQRGLGSFWSTPPVACGPEFIQWLGLDSRYISLGLIYLGYPREGVAARSSRVPLSERVSFHDH